MLAINGSKTDFMIAFWNDERFVLLPQRCEKIDSYTKSGFTLGRDIKYTFELEKNILNMILSNCTNSQKFCRDCMWIASFSGSRNREIKVTFTARQGRIYSSYCFYGMLSRPPGGRSQKIYEKAGYQEGAV